MSRRCGVNIEAYHGDNGTFRSKPFLNEIEVRGQTMNFSGVGAHHQNGVAERAIRTVVESARTMLLHAAIYWPDQSNLMLWPFALEYAAYLWNHLPKRDSGLSPIEIFCGSRTSPQLLRNAHVWGCPVYVLDPKLQDGNKLPKWQPRSRRGQFLGFSTQHSSTIGMILNLRTGYISPQFHVVYDDNFTTVTSTIDPDDMTTPENWEHLFRTSSFHAIPDWDETVNMPELADDWLDPNELQARNHSRDRRLSRQRQTIAPLTRNHPNEHGNPATEGVEVVDDANDLPLPHVDDDPVVNVPAHEDEPDNFPILPDDDHDPQPPEPAPSRRNPPRVKRGRNPRYHGDDFVLVNNKLHGTDEKSMLNDKLLHTLPFDIFPSNYELRQFTAIHEDLTDGGLLNGLHPLAFAAKANAADTPSWHDAMNGPDRDGFLEAMDLEIRQLESMDAWEQVPRPDGRNILDSTWAFKRKRYPDGSLRKLKARLCVRGDQQIEGIDFFETYAPVVAWPTIRLLLVLAVVFGLKTRQVDYTLAFVHAELDDEVFMEMPRMYRKEGYVLRLKKSVYGLRQSPLNWFEKLRAGLEQRGFKSSTMDPCLFIHDKVICLVYVDDCLFFAREDSDIDDIIENLRKNFALNVEDDVAGFLGISIVKCDDGSMQLTQTGLIARVIHAMGLDDSNYKMTPAEYGTLGTDKDGPPCEEMWSYASVVGMMMYLASNTRPDIAFAVHQCARFTHSPKRSHEIALKRIGRYLKGTHEKGMIIRPSKDLSLDCYADADFAGLWNSEDAQDPVCVKSRTGYVLTLGGTPVLWVSKLQTAIALSTMEAEYIALSTAMRDLIPIRSLIDELAQSLQIDRDATSMISTVWEDNNGALVLATKDAPRMTLRSKHIAVQYHWFREHLKPGEIEIKKIDTKQQKADIFTKALRTTEFQDKRKLIVGW